MILMIKIVFGVLFIIYIFKNIVDLFVAFYKPATETAVNAIKEQGLEHYVKYDALEDFFRHLIILLIIGRIFFGTINYEVNVDEMGKQISTISVGEKIEHIDK